MEAEPASSTTACWIYYDRLALPKAGGTLPDLVNMPRGFVSEGYRILDVFELPFGNVKIAVTDPRGNNLDNNLPSPGSGLSASTMANGFRGPASLATFILFTSAYLP